MNHLQKVILICFLIWSAMSGTGNARASELIAREYVQNSVACDIDHVVTSPDPLKFHLAEGLNLSGEWMVGILQNRGSYNHFVPIDSRDSIFVVNFSELDYLSAWRDAKHIYDEENDRYLLEAKVSYKSSDGKEDCIILKLALLPQIPRYSNISFIYEYDWRLDTVLPDSCFSFDATTGGADYCLLLVSYPNLFEMPSSGYYSSWQTDYDVTGDITKISYDGEWGEFIQVSLGNSFGWVHGDILFTTDYIHDEEVLNRIEELRLRAGIDEGSIESASPDFYLAGRSIKFSIPVQNICIYDLNGRLIHSMETVESVNLDSCSPGLYILTYENDSKLYKNKIKL